jgi:hypothetical protein
MLELIAGREASRFRRPVLHGVAPGFIAACAEVRSPVLFGSGALLTIAVGAAGALILAAAPRRNRR